MQIVEYWQSILTVVMFLGTSALTLLQARNTAHLQKADAAQKIGGAYSELLENMRKQLTDLESDVAFLKKELKKYTNWSARLVKQLIENGIEPVPPLDTDELLKYHKDMP